MKSAKFGILFFLVGGLVGAAVHYSWSTKRPEARPFARIMRFAQELEDAARGNGSLLEEETLKKHALEISQFVVGEVPKTHRVIVRLLQEPDPLSGDSYGATPNDLRVMVFYDDGWTGFGHEFIFWPRSGTLKGIIVVPGE